MTRKMPVSQHRKPTFRRKGFGAVSSLLETQIRKAGEKRGFSAMRLLTHWHEIVGQDLAQVCRPVKVGYSRDGFGATLTVLTTGAQAPMLQAQLPQIREKVNTCYGYSAISRVKITQTAPVGFNEGHAVFEGAPPTEKKPVSPEVKATSAALASDVESEDLRRALELLGTNVLMTQK